MQNSILGAMKHFCPVQHGINEAVWVGILGPNCSIMRLTKQCGILVGSPRTSSGSPDFQPCGRFEAICWGPHGGDIGPFLHARSLMAGVPLDASGRPHPYILPPSFPGAYPTMAFVGELPAVRHLD
eukprot:1148780-Pelagomonas_calceolata.AAC.2